MTKRILIITAVATSAILTSCNTIAGIGQDVQKLGTSVHDTAVRSSN